MTGTVRATADRVTLAIGAILVTSLALALGDAIIKQISGGFLLWQIFMLRSIIAIPIVLGIARARHQTVSLVPAAPGWTALRSVMLALMWVAYYAALPHVPLSIAAAVFYTLPLFITLFAALFIGERVGVVGWLAVSLGFAGVLLILKPQGDDFNAHALLPLISAVLYAFAMILTRSKCRGEDPLVLSLSLNVGFIAVGGLATALIVTLHGSWVDADANPFLFGPWTNMGMREWLVMGFLAAVTTIGSVGTAIAYQNGPSSIVSTFDFAYLAFAAFWGLVFFGETPDAISLVGIILIAIAGILSVRR